VSNSLIRLQVFSERLLVAMAAMPQMVADSERKSSNVRPSVRLADLASGRRGCELLGSISFGKGKRVPVHHSMLDLMRISVQEIKRLSQQWQQSVATSQGLTIGGQSEQYRLLANNIGFHELDYDELRTACVELTKLLLLPGANTVIDHDHSWLWHY
jgi:hypothetical protein